MTATTEGVARGGGARSVSERPCGGFGRQCWKKEEEEVAEARKYWRCRWRQGLWLEDARTATDAEGGHDCGATHLQGPGRPPGDRPPRGVLDAHTSRWPDAYA